MDYALVQRLQREIVQLRDFIKQITHSDDPLALINSLPPSSPQK